MYPSYKKKKKEWSGELSCDGEMWGGTWLDETWGRGAWSGVKWLGETWVVEMWSGKTWLREKCRRYVDG